MSTRLKLYIALVTVVAAALLATLLPELTAPRQGNAVFWHYGAWIALCAISETLWLTTISGSGTVTMASSAGLASAMLWGQAPATWIVAISTVIAELFLLKKPPVRVLFNTSQITITMWMAGAAFTLLGGPREGLESAVIATGELAAVRLLLPTFGLFAVYLLVNRALVAVAVAWSTERNYLRVLREDWFYTERLLEDGAAFLMSPLMVMSFKTVGYVGAGLFYAPLKIFNESHRRFIELKSAQQQMIHSERMAAKGEMAAEIGHELRNQLVAISGRSQMLIKDAERSITQNVQRHAQIILEQARRMEQLANGLMGFSHTELKIEKVDLNQLIHRSIEFVRTQNRFDGVDWDLQLCEPAPELRADPGQLQQVLLNLFMNAADAMKEMKESSNGHKKVITVVGERDERVRELRLRVTDTGPGITKSNLAKIFEPHFTTKATGHGFGLSTSYRIITNHGGKLTADSPPGQGATFLVTLPLPTAGSWN